MQQQCMRNAWYSMGVMKAISSHNFHKTHEDNALTK